MIAVAYYLLKVTACSGLLFLYYHLTLRNKIFHQWNRFYLLAIVLLSLLIPTLEFSILSDGEDSQAKHLLQIIYTADEYVSTIKDNPSYSLTAGQWAMITLAAISAFFLVRMLLSLLRLRLIIRSHTTKRIEGINFINTEVRGTPFSFFNYIFWHQSIDLNSSSGKHIFQHELVHVREKHTLDKLFIQMVLIFYWCNPFFWLIQRELRMIHEFIADKRSIGQADAKALAAMILQTSYPNHYNHLTNQFFQSSIKRRLAMLTKNQKSRISYTSRLLALPIIAITAVAFTVKAKESKNEVAASEKKTIETVATVQTATDTISNPLVYIDGVEKGRINGLGNLDRLIKPDQIKAMFVYKGKEAINKYGQKGTGGVIEIFTKAATPPPPPPPPSVKRVATATDKVHAENALVIVDGEEKGRVNQTADINKLLPKGKAVKSIHVYKNDQAIKKYGKKGADGVIEVVTEVQQNQEEPLTEQAPVSITIEE